MIPRDLVSASIRAALATVGTVSIAESDGDFPPVNGSGWTILTPMPGGSTISTLSDPEAIVTLQYEVLAGGQTPDQAQWLSDKNHEVLCAHNGNDFVTPIVGTGFKVIHREVLYGQRGGTEIGGQQPGSLFFAPDRYIITVASD